MKVLCCLRLYVRILCGDSYLRKPWHSSRFFWTKYRQYSGVPMAAPRYLWPSSVMWIPESVKQLLLQLASWLGRGAS